jgi:hypothetical protein
MPDVKVSIHNKDKKIGAMVKALAFEVGNHPAVAGANYEVLQGQGYYTFHFSSDAKADEFKQALRSYLPELFAGVNED